MDVINIIENKLDIIYALIKKVAFQDERSTGSIGRVINRNVFGKFYTNELLRELTIINSYFIIYENQVKHLVKIKEIENNTQGNNSKWAEFYKDTTVQQCLGIYSKDNKENDANNANKENDILQKKTLRKYEQLLTIGTILFGASWGVGIATIPIGVGIPLLSILILSEKAVNLYATSKELLYVMYEVTRIIEQCFYIHYLNCKLMNIFGIDFKTTSINQELVEKVLKMDIDTDNSGETYDEKKQKFNTMKKLFENKVLSKPIGGRIYNGGKRRTQKRKKNKRKAKQVKKSRRRGRSRK